MVFCGTYTKTITYHTTKNLNATIFFALIFGIPSWLFMQFGIMAGCDYRLYIGIGITLYGACYVLVHEGLIHGRIKFFKNVTDYRLIALRNGHLSHHQHDKNADYKKENDVCYGMLWVPMKYFREAKEIQSSKFKV